MYTFYEGNLSENSSADLFQLLNLLKKEWVLMIEGLETGTEECRNYWNREGGYWGEEEKGQGKGAPSSSGKSEWHGEMETSLSNMSCLDLREMA